MSCSKSMRLEEECACRLRKRVFYCKFLTHMVSSFCLADMRAGHESEGKTTVATLNSGPGDGINGAAGSGTSTETAVQKCGSS